MNKYIKLVLTSFILAALVAILPSVVKAQSNGGDDVSQAPVSNTSNGGDDVVASNTSNGSDDVSSSSNTSNGSDDTTSSNVSNGSDDVSSSNTSNGSDDTSSSNTSNGSDDVSSSSNTSNGSDDTTRVSPVTSGSESNNNNSGGRGGSSSRNRNTTPVATPIINGANCSYLTSYLNFDGNNDASEVTKLQTFLKNNEKLNVDINGKFDQKTLDAVKAFQAKYVADTMAPWGVTTPTGQVFYTTKNKINELVCNSKIALTASQLSTIESYKSNVSNGTVNTISETATGTDSLSPVVGSNDNSQTASAAGTSFAGKIWKFVKWIFGY